MARALGGINELLAQPFPVPRRSLTVEVQVRSSFHAIQGSSALMMLQFAARVKTVKVQGWNRNCLELILLPETLKHGSIRINMTSMCSKSYRASFTNAFKSY